MQWCSKSLEVEGVIAVNNTFLLVGIIAVYFMLGVIASETGLVEPVFDIENFAPDGPSESGGFLDKLSSIIAPLAWAFNAMAALFQLASYQADIPVIINTMFFAPLGLIVVITGIKIVRGVNG